MLTNTGSKIVYHRMQKHCCVLAHLQMLLTVHAQSAHVALATRPKSLKYSTATVAINTFW